MEPGGTHLSAGVLCQAESLLCCHHFTWAHQLASGTSPVLESHTGAPPRQSAAPWGYTGPKLGSGPCSRCT